MKNKDLFKLLEGINNVSYFSGVKFNYAVVKNKKLLEAEISNLQEVIKPSEKFQEYERKRVESCEKYCDRYESGEPKVENNAYVILDQSKFDAELEELKVIYKDVLDEREKQIREYTQLMEDDTTVELVKVKQNDLPESITASQLESIFDIVE